jgi:hypothetical protein
MCVGIHIKCLLLFPILTRVLFPRQIVTNTTAIRVQFDGNSFTMNSVPCIRAEGIDILKRIVALRNSANTLTNGKLTEQYLLSDVAHRCYVIYTVHVLIINVSSSICPLWYTIYYIGLCQRRHVSAPRCQPQGVIVTKVYKMSIADGLCIVCPRLSRSSLECTETVSEFGIRNIHHPVWISLGNSRKKNSSGLRC